VWIYQNGRDQEPLARSKTWRRHVQCGVQIRAGKYEFSLEWKWLVVWDICVVWGAYYDHDGDEKGSDGDGDVNIGDVKGNYGDGDNDNDDAYYDDEDDDDDDNDDDDDDDDVMTL